MKQTLAKAAAILLAALVVAGCGTPCDCSEQDNTTLTHHQLEIPEMDDEKTRAAVTTALQFVSAALRGDAQAMKSLAVPMYEEHIDPDINWMDNEGNRPTVLEGPTVEIENEDSIRISEFPDEDSADFASVTVKTKVRYPDGDYILVSDVLLAWFEFDQSWGVVSYGNELQKLLSTSASN